MKRVVILGGGVGGTIVANILAKKAKGAHVTVIDRLGRHVYQPGFLYVAFDGKDPGRFERDERRLLRKGIELVREEIESVDPGKREVRLKGGRTIQYDYLVIATGADIAPEEVPGYKGAHHFYSADGALKLQKHLEGFNGGKIVIAIGGMPYKCPPAPAEAACLLDYYFARRGIKEKVDIHYLSPIGRAFTIETVSPLVTSIFEKKNINYTTFFNVEKIAPEMKTVLSIEGEEVSYDLLILVPPHHGARFLKDSGLTDPGGWVKTDKFTLEVKGHEGLIWAIGDATDIPISKAGATVHYEAKVVAENVAALVKGEKPSARYDGKVICFFDGGFHRAFAIRFDYENPPAPPPLSLRWYIMKHLLNRLYWYMIPKGRV